MSNIKLGEMVLYGASQKNTVICLIGIDGSGKTTHARRIVLTLQKFGLKCKYVWFGTPYFLSYPFMAICRILGFTESHHLQNGMSVSEHRYYLNKAVALVFPWIQFLDLSVFVFLRVYMALFLGFTVVCDRFVYDILAGIMADIKDDELHNKSVGRLILGLTPRSALVYLLDVDEMTAFQRKYDVPNVEYLRSQRKHFRLIAKHLNINVVNANNQFFAVHEELIKGKMDLV